LEEKSEREKLRPKEIKRINNSMDKLRRSIPRNWDNAISWKKPFSLDVGLVNKIIHSRCRSNRVSYMPISAYVCWYKINQIIGGWHNEKILGLTKGYEIHGEGELHPIGRMIYKREDSKYGHRRGFAVAFNQLKANELNRQYKRMGDIKKNTEGLRKDNHLNNFRNILLESEIKVMKKCENSFKDKERIDIVIRYFNRHKGSSLISGLKYEVFLVRDNDQINYTLTRPIIYEVMNIIGKGIKGLLNWTIKNKKRIQLWKEIPAILFKHSIFGSRQREGDLEINFNENKMSIVERILRTRWVTGLIIISHWWIFFTEDEVTEIEKEILKEMRKLISFKFYSPMTEGGETWNIVLKLIEKYGNGYIVDGVSWENTVGNLLHPLGCIWLGFLSLGSGGSFTTIVGIAALMFTSNYYVQQEELDIEEAIGFGDNIIMFGNKLKDIKGILETEIGDNENQLYLGISLLKNRVLAPKICRDSADKAKSTTIFGLKDVIRYDYVDQQRRIATYIMYGFTDIIKPIELMAGYGYKGGGYLEEFIESAIEKVPSQIRKELIKYDNDNLNKYWNLKYIREDKLNY
jgi:hypothetical protein